MLAVCTSCSQLPGSSSSSAEISKSSTSAAGINWLQPNQMRPAMLHMKDMTTTKEVKRGAALTVPFLYQPLSLQRLPVQDEQGNTVPLEELLRSADTDGFLVLHEGKIVYETYFHDMKSSDLHGMASVSKVFTGLLVSLLTGEKKLSLSASAAEYVPELRGTPFGKATLQQLLDMQVSAMYPTHGFQQEGLANQDAQLYLASHQLPRPFGYEGPDSILGMLREARETDSPGAAFAYNNGSTETLAAVLRRVTGRSLSDLVSTRIWRKLGAEQDAMYVTDPTGAEQASAGFNATLRDMGRFGQMMLRNGSYHSKRVIPAAVVQEIRQHGDQEIFSRSTAAAKRPDYSYHNQWWLTNNEHGAFEVMGSYGQRLYIDPAAEMVIVQFSSRAIERAETDAAMVEAYRQITGALLKS
nr:serine hydrolase [Ectobacillus ponti]